MKPYITLAMSALSILFLAGCTDTSTSSAKETHSEHVKNLDDASFAAATASGIVVVDFWATWCPPCRTQGPIIDALAESAHERATIAKVDVDKAEKTASQFNIESIPTIIVMKDGKILNRFVGVTSKETLLDAIAAAE